MRRKEAHRHRPHRSVSSQRLAHYQGPTWIPDYTVTAFWEKLWSDAAFGQALKVFDTVEADEHVVCHQLCATAERGARAFLIQHLAVR